jgi:hypothetical protein
MVVRFALNTLTLLWYLSVISVIYIGWTISDQRYVVAESGTGYWLGIIGGSMMLLLLVYPLRKKKPQWKFLGSIKFWFRFHMLLGIVGPVLVIFHSGYRLGSLNSRVAILSMLIVASSGLIGRYLYRRIHHGLYGEKILFEDIYRSDKDSEQLNEWIKDQYPQLIEQLNEHEDSLLNRHTGVNRSLGFYLNRRWNLRELRKKVSRSLPASEERKKLLDRLWSLRSICNLGINEILFSYWHVLHFPLFIMLVISGFTHVAVVHFY